MVVIVVENILETYGMWLSRDWSEKLKGYFSIDWSHLWLPYNGRPNQIKVVGEPLMKQTITNLIEPSEPDVFFTSAIENYTFDTFFGNLLVDTSPTQDVDKLSEIDNCKVVPFIREIVHNVYNVNTNFMLNLSYWTLFFMVINPRMAPMQVAY